MKHLRLIAVFLCCMTIMSCAAQKNKKKKGQAEEPAKEEQKAPEQAVSEQCLINMSLFYESAKNRNYTDALQPWMSVYEECPQHSKLIYTYGSRIINWQIEKAATDEEKEVLFNKLMKLYDDQIKYFGNDQRNPTPWILGMKSYYYILYKPENKSDVYPWLKEAVSQLGVESEPSFIQQFVVISSEMYKEDPNLAEQFINDYLLANGFIEANANNPSAKDAEIFRQLKESLDALFVISGVADCERLNEIYQERVENNKENLDYLSTTIRFFKRLGCTDKNAFFSASKYAHLISPSAESANGLAEMNFKNNNFAKAIEYYNEAATLTTDNLEKADYFFKIAQIYYSKLENMTKAKEFAKLSLQNNANQSSPYM